MPEELREPTPEGLPPRLARCPACGYDLTGTDLDAKPCPECGWEATEQERRRRRSAFEEKGGPLGAFVLMVVGAYLALIEIVAQLRMGTDAIAILAGVFRAELVLLIGVAAGFGASRLAPRGERGACFAAWEQTLPWLMLPFLVTFPMLRLELLAGPSMQIVPGLGVLLAMVGPSGWLVHVVWLSNRHLFEPGRGAAAFAFAALLVVVLSLWPAAAAQAMIWADV